MIPYRLYLILALKLNIISCSHLNTYKVKSTFPRVICTLSNHDEINRVMGSFKKRDSDDLYAAKILVPMEIKRINYNKRSESNIVPENDNQAVSLWHKKMAYTNTGIIREIIQDTRYGMKATENLQRNHCTTRVQSKLTKTPSRGNVAGHLFNVFIHTDACRPLKTPTFWRKYVFCDDDNWLPRIRENPSSKQ